MPEKLKVKIPGLYAVSAQSAIATSQHKGLQQFANQAYSRAYVYIRAFCKLIWQDFWYIDTGLSANI